MGGLRIRGTAADHTRRRRRRNSRSASDGHLRRRQSCAAHGAACAAQPGRMWVEQTEDPASNGARTPTGRRDMHPARRGSSTAASACASSGCRHLRSAPSARAAALEPGGACNAMTLPDNWTAPATWTAIEKTVFATLQNGVAYDARSAAEQAQAASRTLVVTRNRPVTISGAFLSEIVRKYTDEFPIGVQLLGVAVDGEVALESVRIEKILSLEHCYFTGPIIARGTKFLWVSLTGSVVEGYFDMRSAIISGAVFLRWGFQSLTSTLLRDITVTGPVDCSGAGFKYDALRRIGEFGGAAEGESFSLARGIASALFWKEMRERPTGFVNLRNVQVKSLRDGKDEDHPESVEPVRRDWPAAGHLRMSGLKYEEQIGRA